jgi:hypothetical protein
MSNTEEYSDTAVSFAGTLFTDLWGCENGTITSQMLV